MGRKSNGNGSVRKIDNDKWECIIQSSIIDENTLKPKRIKRVGATQVEAEKRAKEALAIWEKEQTEKMDYKSSKAMPFGEYVTDYINVVCAIERKDTCGASTILNYTQNNRQYIQKYSISKMQLPNLNKKVFQDYYDTLTLKYAPASIKVAVQLCVRTCEWLVQRKVLKENFAKQARPVYEKVDEFEYVKQIQHKEIFTNDDIGKFLAAYKSDLTEYAPVVIFLLETGMRPEEFAVLSNDDINLVERTIHVQKTLSRRLKAGSDKKTEPYIKVPKTDEDRYIKISSALLVECIEKMQYKVSTMCAKNVNDYFYPSFITGRYRQIATMEVGFKFLCDKIGVDRGVYVTRGGSKKGLNLYALRHTYESLRQADGTNPVVSAYMAGHSLKTALEHYTHINADILDGVELPSVVDISQGTVKKEKIVGEVDDKMVESLRNIKMLFDEGILTEEEYTQQKILILSNKH